MAKVIRIGELPVARELVNEDLLVVNSFADDRTYSITWADMLGSITEISQPVFFSRGTETRPSIAFVDFNAGFYSPGPAALAVTTNGTTRMSFDADGNIVLGSGCDVGSIIFHSPVTYTCDATYEQDVQIDGNVIVRGDIQVNGELDFIGNIGVQIDGNLTVTGDTVLGDPSNGCAGLLQIHSLTTFHCDTFFQQDLTVTKNITIGGDTSTGNLTVVGDSLLQGEVTITDDVTISDPLADGNITIDASTGSINLSGNLNVGGILSGDGSGITNLNIPGSLSFKGAIDLTTTAPSNPQTGDLYITEDGPGTVNFSFNGISGQTFQDNQFVFYTVDNLWQLGSVQDTSGIVTLSGTQTITGEKTYTQVLNALGGINSTGNVITANNLSLSGKATSASTQVSDPITTLTTKDYVDNRSLNAVADFPLTLGAYITGSPNDFYDGEVAVTANIDATPNNTPNFVVARDASGDFTANIITSDLNGRAKTTSKLDVNNDESSANQSYPLFIQDGTPTSGNVALEKDVFADTGLSYVPSTNTLTVSNVVSDITGDITGNVSTATALETPRTLWGQTFDGTANVSGDIIFTGNIISDGNNTKNIGSSVNVFSNVYATTFYGYLDGSALVADRTKEKLTAGLHILSSNGVTEFDGSAATTWYVDTDSNSTANKIVVRDTSGNFSSNVITANEFVGPLTGNVVGNITGSSGSSTGNSATATQLETTRTLWGQSFNGTANVTGSLINTGDITPVSGSTFDLGSSSLTYKNIYVDTINGNIEGNSGSSDKVNNPLTRGQYLSGGDVSFDGSAPSTWNIDATPSNTANFIVARDSAGDFSAGTITANQFVGNLTGNVTGDVSGSSGSTTGNAVTATTLETTRTLWGQSFNGSANVTGNIDNTGNILPTTNVTSTIGSETLQYSDIYATTFHGNLDGISDIANQVKFSLYRGAYMTGSFISFNGSQEDTWNIDATPSLVADTVVARDASGNFSAGTITAIELIGDVTGNASGDAAGSSSSCTGNSATGSKLLTPKDITVTITGATIGTGSTSFDGSSNVEIDVITEGIVDLLTLDPLPA